MFLGSHHLLFVMNGLLLLLLLSPLPAGIPEDLCWPRWIKSSSEHLGNTVGQLCMRLTQNLPPFVLRSDGSGHSPPIEYHSLIRDVVMEPGLCKDVSTTVSGIPSHSPISSIPFS